MINEYSAVYFNRASDVLRGKNIYVTMQVFQKNQGILCGMTEVIKLIEDEAYGPVEISALSDGDDIYPWEPVMTIKGNLCDFVHLESVYLGILARGTKVASNARRLVKAANGKPVLFFADRFDRFENQTADGYAATLGGVSNVCTHAMARGARRLPGHSNDEAIGTMPHALIAAFGGNVVEASKAFRERFPSVPLTALVDFNNDCVVDSLACLREFGKDLFAVRLDTSEKMIDKSLLSHEGEREYYGVNPALVRNVRDALDHTGGKHVKIVVSGGFDVDKVTAFETMNVPVDIYAVGSSLLKGSNDFTADVVEPVAKEGRWLRDTSRLVKIN